MIDAIRRLFGAEPDAEASAETEAMRAIGEALERLEPDRARFIAAFAYVLSRVASADNVVTRRETLEMERIVREHASLPGEQAALVVQIAKAQNRLRRGTEDYLVTRELAQMASPEQKRALIECLYAVSASDSAIVTAEENEIQGIARELKVEHRDVIAIRSRYRRHLAVLNEPPASGDGN